jgi:hypothetical protein
MGFAGKKHVRTLLKKIWVMDRVCNFWKGMTPRKLILFAPISSNFLQKDFEIQKKAYIYYILEKQQLA